MPLMGESDEIVQRLQRKRADERRAAKEQDAKRAAEERGARQGFAASAEQLAPAAIDALRKAGWPGATLIEVDARQGWPRFLKGGKTKEIAGWPVGAFTWVDHHGAGGNVSYVYLLPDGRWIGGAYLGPPVPRSFQEVLDSVRGLTQRHPGARLMSETPSVDTSVILANLRSLADGDFSGLP
ncbi:MAG TPA: hypothetical protein VHF90_05395 [Thermoleophilaceae bacterium]|nr:hypothetical protein [Thermoleophilaceae bacterium]